MCRTITMQLLKEIHEASIYSLIADEATDITNKEQLCISIRWVDPFCVIHEDALELTALTKTDSETIANAIKDFLLRYQLPISKCRGQAYDGASNMSGIIKGVATRIQNEEASAVYVHCLAHSLNLCLQTLAKCVTPIKEALDITMELGKFIDLSPKRSQLMSTLKAQLSPECQTPSIKMLCPTRWTVRTKALEAIIKSYKILIPALIEIQSSGKDEYALKAGGFVQSLDKYSTYYGLKLSHLIFSATSSSLQYKDTSVQEAVAGANLAVSFLERQRSDKAFNDFYEQCLLETKDLTAEPVLPRYRRIPRRADDGSQQHKYSDAKSMHRQQYFEAFDTVKGEIINRFQQKRGMPVFFFFFFFFFELLFKQVGCSAIAVFQQRPVNKTKYNTRHKQLIQTNTEQQNQSRNIII